MEMNIGSRLKHAWNAFLNRDPPGSEYYGGGYSYRPDRMRFSRGSERTIINAINNRISLDASSIKINHVKLDENNRFDSIIDSGLNYCLNTEANADQTGRGLIQDIVMTFLEEGVAAVVPEKTNFDPRYSNSYEIYSMRVGVPVEWYPNHVRVRLFNELTGQKEEITFPKKMVALIENPFYAVMNAPNSTMQQLVRKLALLDAVDEQAGSGKLDMIIQLPYVIKSQARQDQVEQRRAEIEKQLSDSKYGIAYKVDPFMNMGVPKELLTGEKMLAKGADIGNQLAQNIGITFPYRIDNYCKIVCGMKHQGRYSDDMHIIHRSKEVLLKVLEGVKAIAAEYGLILNEKKTHICKLSGEYRYLQMKYTLLQNGVVVRRIHPKAITRERRKLKAYKRLLDKGIVTMEEIDGYFRSWLSGNYKYMSRDQIYKMNSLYVKLFGRSVTWKKGHGRLRWLMAHPSAA